MEAEVRAILTDSVSQPDAGGGLLVAVLERFGELGGVELELPRRVTPTRVADLFQ